MNLYQQHHVLSELCMFLEMLIRKGYEEPVKDLYAKVKQKYHETEAKFYSDKEKLKSEKHLELMKMAYSVYDKYAFLTLPEAAEGDSDITLTFLPEANLKRFFIVPTEGFDTKTIDLEMTEIDHLYAEFDKIMDDIDEQNETEGKSE